MLKTLLPEITDPEALEALGEAIAGVFARWGIHAAEQRRLLGTEQPLRSDAEQLPNDAAALEHTGLLLAIDRALAKQDSVMHELAAWWLRTPHPALSGESPLEIMLSQGIRGMQRVRAIIEFDQGQS